MSEKITCDCDAIHEDTVKKVAEKMIAREDAVELSLLFKMFADPTRIRILYALETHEMCVCDLAVLMNMTKSAVSHQLKQLKIANLVKSKREGQNVFYSLADDHIRTIIDIGFEHIKE